MRAVLIAVTLLFAAAAAQPAPPVCSEQPSVELISLWDQTLGREAPPPELASTLPECPEIRTCPGTCAAAGGLVTDTGWTACSGNGYALRCQDGKTVHIASGGCRYGLSCCTTVPACVCVNCPLFSYQAAFCQ